MLLLLMMMMVMVMVMVMMVTLMVMIVTLSVQAFLGAESCAAASGALCDMVCANCGQWSYRYTWHDERLADQDPRRQHSYVDPGRPELYWFMVCKPNCELNAVRHASFQLEEEAAYWSNAAWSRSYVAAPGLRRAVEDLRRAWTAYYATW